MGAAGSASRAQGTWRWSAVRRWTRKAMAWTAGGVMALMLGLWREDYQVVAVGIVMAIFILVAYSRRTPKVYVRRRPSHLRVLEGDVYSMGFSVGAEGGWADMVEVHDSVPGYMRVEEGSNHMFLPLYKGEMRTTSYLLDCPLRGSYRVGPPDVRTSDAIGFFDQEETVRDIHDLDVVPMYVELRSLEIASRALKYNMGPVTVNELGRSTDFYSIRQYIKGDPYRKINWKASARYRKLMINEDEKETLSDCAIFVDSRTLTATGTPLENFHEASLRSTLGLARTLVASKNRVMVVTYNDSVNIVPPGLGTAHNGVIQAMLVETVARGALTFDWAAGYARPFLKPRSDIVVFSPLVSDMTFFPTLLGLIRRGHRVVVVTGPLEEYERRGTDGVSNRALLMGLQRSTNMAELEAAGVPVIEADPDEPQLSMMVRVSAALGGELLDVAALVEEEEVPVAVEEFEEAPPMTFGSLPISLQEEVLGLKIGKPRVLLLQALAAAALVGVLAANYFLNSDVWDALNDLRPGQVIDGATYALLVGGGLLIGWAISMTLGFIRYVRELGVAERVVYLAYASMFLIVLWHMASLVMNSGTAFGLRTLVHDMVMLPAILGSMAVFRRQFPLAAFTMVYVLLLGLAYANPMNEGLPSLVGALLVVAYLEMVWGVQRFDRLYELGSPTMTKERGLDLMGASINRYMLVLGILLIAATLVASVLTFLPGWYVADPVPGIADPIDAGTTMAPVHLLFWLVMIVLTVRWAVISLLETKVGIGLVERVRQVLVMPGARRKGDVETEEAEDGPDALVWDEETPPPDVPVPHG